MSKQITLTLTQAELDTVSLAVDCLAIDDEQGQLAVLGSRRMINALYRAVHKINAARHTKPQGELAESND